VFPDVYFENNKSTGISLNKLAMRVILIILLILVMFMAFILLGFSDAFANDNVKNQVGHIHLVMSVLVEGAV
jgi:hypothetical protein